MNKITEACFNCTLSGTKIQQLVNSQCEREALMNQRDFKVSLVTKFGVIEKDAEGIKRINPLPLRARYSDERESRMETCPDNFYDRGRCTPALVFVTNLYVSTLLARCNQGRNQEMRKNKKKKKRKEISNVTFPVVSLRELPCRSIYTGGRIITRYSLAPLKSLDFVFLCED